MARHLTPRHVAAACLWGLLVGCGGAPELELACAAVGAPDGLDARVASSLVPARRTLEIEVCDGMDCGARRLEVDPPGRLGLVVVPSLDWGERGLPSPGAGEVTVSLTLLDGQDRVVAGTEQQVQLAYQYPNGRECDGDTLLSGSVRLRARDAV